MYKVRKIKESELKEYTGKIISVISSETKEDLKGWAGSIGQTPIYEKYLILTCLVKE